MLVEGVTPKAVFFALGLWAAQAFGQSVGNGSVSSIFNSRLATSLAHADTVPISSQAISQIADGAGWKTTMVLVNTDTVPANYTLNFWHGDGTPLTLPTNAQGSLPQITGTIPVNGSVTIETPGDAGGAFSQGWGQLVTSNSIGGTTIFRQANPGQEVSEASVPITRPAGNVLILPFDNRTGFATSLALVNPDPATTAVVQITIYDQSGNVVGGGVINVPPQGQQAFALNTQFPSSAGINGTVNFTSVSVPITGLGLRFSGQVFTSVQMLAPGQ